jgi:general secretion pathway protein G
MLKNRFERSPVRFHGFSLLELIAVLTIIGVLAVVIIPRLGEESSDSQRQACRQRLAELHSAIQNYYYDRSFFPQTMTELYPRYHADPRPVCPVFNEAYVLDVATGRIQGHDHP